MCFSSPVFCRNRDKSCVLWFLIVCFGASTRHLCSLINVWFACTCNDIYNLVPHLFHGSTARKLWYANTVYENWKGVWWASINELAILLSTVNGSEAHFTIYFQENPHEIAFLSSTDPLLEQRSGITEDVEMKYGDAGARQTRPCQHTSIIFKRQRNFVDVWENK